MSFTKFDAKAFLAGEGEGTFASFATFAAAAPQTQKPEREGGGGLSKMRVGRPATAKVAKVAKEEVPDRAETAALLARYRSQAVLVRHDGLDTPAKAQARAWHGTAALWYRRHGSRVPATLCAGCGQQLDGETNVLLLPLGERAHAADGYACIRAYGRRWKHEATAALLAIGIPTPQDMKDGAP